MAHECSRDGTPCYSYTSCYHHLKAERGEGHLSEQELEFIGYTSTTRAPRDGWHDISTVGNYELTAYETRPRTRR